MTTDNRRACWISAVLASCLSFAGAACVVTGFDLPNAELKYIGLFCLLFSICGAAMLFFMKNGWKVLVFAYTAGALLLWFKGGLDLSVEALAERISGIVRLGYGTPVIHWSGVDLTEVSLDMGLCFAASFAALAVIITLWKQKSILLALPLCLILPAVCVVLTDTVPDTWCLMLLASPLVLLALTNTVRRRSQVDGNRLTAALMIPCLLVTSLLFWAVPREGNHYQMDLDMQNILGYFQFLPFIHTNSQGQLYINFDRIQENSYDLSTLGPRNNPSFKVMEVRYDRGGILYLRGQSYDAYDGKSWKISNMECLEYSQESQNYTWRTQGMKYAGMVNIFTSNLREIKYTPYNLAMRDLKKIVGGSVQNVNDQRIYAYQQRLPNDEPNPVPCTLDPEDWETLTQLPAGSREELQNIVKEIWLKELMKYMGDSDSNSRWSSADFRAELIANYVRGIASYDLNSPQMPAGETDFALWFLTSAESGYCVHYATALAALLRAGDIPARIVMGYAMELIPGKTTQITGEKAHAWVEYFSGTEGWKILDATPGSVGDPNYIPTVQPVDPDASEPPVTEPEKTEPLPTEPAERPTEPTETTPTEIAPTETVSNMPTQPTTLPPEPGTEPMPESGGAWLQGLLVSGCWMLGIAMAVLTILCQARLRLWLRMRRGKKGTSNQRCIALWREIRYRSRILHVVPEEALFDIADKAKFSQHTISDEELAKLENYLKKTSGWVRYAGFGRKLFYTLVFAIQ